MKRLALFLDGTWNAPGDNTNVWRLRSMLAREDGEGAQQHAYYDTGVGTGPFDRIRGGAGGMGLSTNVRQAYQWLVERYDDGDEIYLFGFSRGAFTARSLAGMIAWCGLLRPGAPMPVGQVFERYERRGRAIYKLPADPAGLDLEDRWIVTHSRRVPIRMIGVWDTVGALGLPFGRDARARRGEFGSHFTRLSRSFEHVYHALALDENRKAYRPSRFYHFVPESKPDKQREVPPHVEQRWFVGAHANVGGGYRNDELAQIPLAWMHDRAARLGLAFRSGARVTGDEHRAPVADSFAHFLRGAYRLIKAGRRHWRPLGVRRSPVEGGWLDSVSETVDATVLRRWREDPGYRPENLRSWAESAGVDVREVAGDLGVS